LIFTLIYDILRRRLLLGGKLKNNDENQNIKAVRLALTDVQITQFAKHPCCKESDLQFLETRINSNTLSPLETVHYLNIAQGIRKLLNAPTPRKVSEIEQNFGLESISGCEYVSHKSTNSSTFRHIDADLSQKLAAYRMACMTRSEQLNLNPQLRLTPEVFRAFSTAHLNYVSDYKNQLPSCYEVSHPSSSSSSSSSNSPIKNRGKFASISSQLVQWEGVRPTPNVLPPSHSNCLIPSFLVVFLISLFSWVKNSRKPKRDVY
jgi:hypothetical protein